MIAEFELLMIPSLYTDQKMNITSRLCTDLAHQSPSGKLAVRQGDKNQHSKYLCGDAERGLLPIPILRLPHGEVFARDHHKPEKPEAKAYSQSGYRPDLVAVEHLGG